LLFLFALLLSYSLFLFSFPLNCTYHANLKLTTITGGESLKNF
jgi:hypothetical protein